MSALASIAFDLVLGRCFLYNFQIWEKCQPINYLATQKIAGSCVPSLFYKMFDKSCHSVVALIIFSSYYLHYVNAFVDRFSTSFSIVRKCTILNFGPNVHGYTVSPDKKIQVVPSNRCSIKCLKVSVTLLSR